MDKDNKIHYKYMEILSKLDLNSKVNNDILQLFSVYISSNKNFKYNKTYLSDSIEPFIEVIKSVQNKALKCNEFANFLSRQYKSFDDWIIIIDNIFLIDSDFCFHHIYDLLDRTIYKQEKLNKYLSKYNLFNENKKKVLFKYINMTKNGSVDYTKLYNLGEISLLSLVEKTLEKKKDEGE